MGNNKRKTHSAENGSTEEDEKCPFCDGFYKKKGIPIHISRSHPEQARNKIADSYQSTPKVSTEPISSEEMQYPEDSPEAKNAHKILEDKMDEFLNLLNPMLETQPEEIKLCEIITDFAGTLRKAMDILPGPKNPAKKFIDARKRQSTFVQNEKQYCDSKNPQRSSNRDRQRRRAKYKFEMLQHLYYYSRKKCVRVLMQSSFASESCTIPLDILHDSYSAKWSNPNNSILENYGPMCSSKDQDLLDLKYDCHVSAEEVEAATKGINNDSATGLDGVPVRIIKRIGKKCYAVISVIASIMQIWNVVPTMFQKARTVLILKNKDEKQEVNGWRPISICSILRRIIERVFDKRQEEFILINENQVGFSRHPGTFINASIVNGCLAKAKVEKTDLCVVMLDVRKAFEESSHVHMEKCYDHITMPSKLRNIEISLMKGNETQIQTSQGLSKPIAIKRGVFQGAPTSPRHFNLSIDHVLKELTEHEISNRYGVQLHSDIPNVSARGFADDLALFGNSIEAVRELTKIAILNLNKVGYTLNYDKCKIINIRKGKLVDEPLLLDENISITAVKSGKRIRYLGVNFNDEIIFEPDKIIKNFSEDLQNLVGTPMLYPTQKLKIINQYLWPTLIYPLQTAPIHKLSKKFLEDLDKLIKSSVREIVGLPSDTPNAMLYTSQKYRGLQIVRSTWEAFIQHYNICIALFRSNDIFIPYVRNLEEEMTNCMDSLNLSENEMEVKFESKPKTKRSQIIRQQLRDEEYKKWCELKSKGAGVELFSEFPEGNKLIMEKDGLTTSEWVAVLKMSANVFPVRSIPGRSLDNNPQCRHCTERETLSHVLGSCPRGSLLRNTRHHEVRSILAKYLRQSPSIGRSLWKAQEEVFCLDSVGGNKRVDILCYDEVMKTGFIIDPTVRFEQNHEQVEAVHREKSEHYEPCIPYFLEKYKLERIEVIGLLFGARGTITSAVLDFKKKFILPHQMIRDIIVAVIRGSHRIAYNHVYNNT